jgi:hypothetical protein
MRDMEGDAVVFDTATVRGRDVPSYTLPFCARLCYSIVDVRKYRSPDPDIGPTLPMHSGANTNTCLMLLSMLKDVAILRKRLCNFSVACRYTPATDSESSSRMTNHIASASRSDGEAGCINEP